MSGTGSSYIDDDLSSRQPYTIRKRRYPAATMASLSITVAAGPGLRGRFARAAAAEPLCALSPAARAELDGLLGRARELDELPGRWQAALLRAEASLRGAPPSAGGSCCGGGAAA